MTEDVKTKFTCRDVRVRCGKSTFLRTFNRMNDTIDGCRVSGKIHMDGQDIYDPNLDPVLLRAQVGMVFQKPNPFPKSIYDNIAFLMDEPASALDPIATAKLEALIEELKERYCIIIVTHSMAQAARVSDKTAFFYMGDLIEYDDTDKIFTNPGNSRTQDYITGRTG